MSSLKGIAKYLLDNGPRKMVPTSRRVRVLFNNTYIVDTTEAIHVWEHDYFPQYYVHWKAIQNCTHKIEDEIPSPNGGAGASILNIKVPGTTNVDERSTNRVLRFMSGPLEDLVKLEFNSMGMYFCRWERTGELWRCSRSLPTESRMSTLRSSLDTNPLLFIPRKTILTRHEQTCG